MHLPAWIEWKADARLDRVSFCCPRCGHRRDADVLGSGVAPSSLFTEPGYAEKVAGVEARADVARTLRTARCPSCRQRAPGALLAFWQPLIILFACTVLAGVALGYLPTWMHIAMPDDDKAACRWFIPMLLSVAALFALAVEAPQRWRRLDKRVRWIERSDPE